MGKDAHRRLAELRDDAYLLVLKCLVGKGYSLKADLLMSKLRKELCVSEERHSELRAQLASGKLADGTRPQGAAGTPGAGADTKRGLGSASKSKSKRQKVPEPHEQAPGAFLAASGPGVQLDPLIGQKVSRLWPGHTSSGWYEGVISDYNPETGEHCIMYDAGTPEESFEWFDVYNGKETEVRRLDEKVDVLSLVGAKAGAAAQARAAPAAGAAGGTGQRADNGSASQRKRGARADPPYQQSPASNGSSPPAKNDDSDEDFGL